MLIEQSAEGLEPVAIILCTSRAGAESQESIDGSLSWAVRFSEWGFVLSLWLNAGKLEFYVIDYANSIFILQYEMMKWFENNSDVLF